MLTVYFTLYGYPDNSPPGDGISYPMVHQTAGGTGTYDDPVTFATDRNEEPPGTRIYVPAFLKYAIMEDGCSECNTAWNANKQYRFDFWLSSNASSDSCKVNACELHWTQNQTTVEINPPPGRPVDPTPLYDTTTNTCTATRIPGGSPDGGPTEVTSDGCPTVDAGAPDAGTSDASAPEAGPIEGGVPLLVSSSALAPGAAFAKDNTCAGLDVSPPLTWSGAPAGTQGYAIVFENLTTGEIDWAIWDIPASTTSIPQITAMAPYPMQSAAVVGAQQALVDGPEAVASQEATYGYVGPCPQGATQSYQFTVYAVDTASTPGVTFQSALADVKAAVAQHALASGTLGGTSNATLRTNP
jgi:Raf kinase inhibitor-like YbhB/YbcL family protein